MNIKVQCCGLIILFVLMYFYIKQKKIKLRTERIYFVELVTTLMCVSLDILSLVLLEYRADIPQILVSMVCKLYLVTLVIIGAYGFIYICADVYKNQKKFRSIRKYTNICIVCTGIVILCLPIHYYIYKSHVQYTEGYGVIVTYFVTLTFVVMTLILMYRNRNLMNRMRYQCAMIWLIIWIAAAVIQFLFNSLLIVGYAISIGMMILYEKLENPENNLDRNTGLFNQTALNYYIEECQNAGKEYYILYMHFDDSDSTSIDIHDIDKYRKQIMSFFDRIKGSILFLYTEADLIFCFESEEEANKGIELIRNALESSWCASTYVFRYDMVYLSNCEVTNSMELIMKTVRYIRKRIQNLAHNSYVCVTQNIIDQINYEKNIEKLITEVILDTDRIQVYYQPIYSFEHKCFSSAEALVRIIDKDGNIVPPGSFIEIAEQNGSIIQIGEIVFRKVCSFLNDNYYGQSNSSDIKLPESFKYIEINLSVVQCSLDNLADRYIEIMKEYKIKPEWINLEITETAILQDKRILLKNMTKLREYGVKFSLDDFGMGASNLNYIVDMPVDIVKFDKNFTNSYFVNNKAKYVMEAALQMIHGLKLKIVAEGIETKEQLDSMNSLDIDYIQGYYFSKPVNVTDFCKFIIEKDT